MLVAPLSALAARPQQEMPILEVGKPLERELAGGQAHSYLLNLTTGQLIDLSVEQKGIDVAVKLFAPDGALVIEVDSPNGDQGPEPIRLITEATGAYRLEVSSLEPSARPGRYEAKLIELRAASQTDRDLLVARLAYDEATRLSNQVTRESLPQVVEKYEVALALYRQANDQRGQFMTLLGLAAVHRQLGQFPRALAQANQASQIATALGDRGTQAEAADTTAFIYRVMGDFDQALRFSEEALRLDQAAGNKATEAATLRSMGELYSYLGEQETAREYADRAIRLYQVLGDKRGEASTLRSVAVSYTYDENWPQALSAGRRALALLQQINNRDEVAAAHSFIGLEYARAGARQEAIEHATEALRLRPALGDGPEAAVLTNVGYLYGKLGDHEKAEGYFTEALRIWRAVGAKRGEALALRHFSLTLRGQGRLAEARATIEAAISLLEIMRDHAGSPEQQASLIASLFDFYEIYIDLVMRLHAAEPKAGHDLTALAFSEKVKQRNLKDLLTAGWVELDPDVDAALLGREHEINERVTASLDKLTNLLKGTFTEAQKVAAEKELELRQAELRRVQEEIRGSSPRYSALTQPQPLAVGEIQRQLLDGNTVLLEYALGSDCSYLWAITPEGVQSYKLPPKAEVEALALRVYKLLTARQPARDLTVAQQRTREAEADRQLPIEAARLSKMLLGPVAAQLGSKRLLIVADGALQYLPFAVLPTPVATEVPTEAKPLIVEHEIVSLPSASVLTALRSEFAGRKPAPKPVAVLADPVYQLQDPRVKTGSASNRRATTVVQEARPGTTSAPPSTTPIKRTRDGRELGRLLFSRDEAEAIMAATPDRAGLLALDFRANRRLAMSDELGQYRILHFSSHGLLDSRRPELSGLVLSQVNQAGQPQEGFLRLHEIYNLRLNADLVVLSACQTALGRDVRGEGLIGLTRGFMYAGAPRVVASLWEVDDAATTELMKRFYRGLLRDKLTVAAALRAAQIEMLQKKHWRSPYYWGAFVLQGEWK